MLTFALSPRKTQPSFVIVGGIEFSQTAAYVHSGEYDYDAVFVGRYHPQKGIYHLLNIWKQIVEQKPLAKLAILGNGDPAIEKEILDFIREQDSSISEVDLFDLYRGEQIPEGKKGLAFAIRMKARDRTMTDEEVHEIFGKVVEGVRGFFGAFVR